MGLIPTCVGPSEKRTTGDREHFPVLLPKWAMPRLLARREGWSAVVEINWVGLMAFELRVGFLSKHGSRDL